MAGGADTMISAGLERQLLWHAVQQPRLQGGGLPHGPAAGAVFDQGFRWWQDTHCHGHLTMPGSDEGSPDRPCPQVHSLWGLCSAYCINVVLVWRRTSFVVFDLVPLGFQLGAFMICNPTGMRCGSIVPGPAMDLHNPQLSCASHAV